MMTAHLRLFNNDGIIEFERVIGEIRSENLNSVPEDLIFGQQFTDLFEPELIIENIDVKNKSDLVSYLVSKLALRENKHLYFDKGLWTWLTAFYFESICPVAGNGYRKVNENAFYVLKDPKNYTKYYRHLLAYPSRLNAELGDSSKIFLVGSFNKRGEITEQFGAYQEIALNKGILDAANMLYWDHKTNNLKRGVAGKGPGSARRLVRIVRQYQMTYDLNSMSGNDIVNLLPSEFAKWKN